MIRITAKIDAIEEKLVTGYERVSGEPAPAHVKAEIVKLPNEATAEIEQDGVPPTHGEDTTAAR